MFLPVEENNIPSTASIEVTQVEEYRGKIVEFVSRKLILKQHII